SLDHLPLRGVHHEGNLRDFRLAGQQLQETGHRGHAVDHALIHADVDDVGAVLHLLARDAYRLLILAFLDQLRELGRPGDIRPLTDHHVDAVLLGKRLRPGEAERAKCAGTIRWNAYSGSALYAARRFAFERLRDRGNVFRRVAATTAGDVD